MSADDNEAIVENAGVKYRIMNKQDFHTFRDIIEDMQGWTQKFENDTTKVWTKPPDPASGSKLNMIKLCVEYPNVLPKTLYNALHDADYRKSWDDNMIKGYNICRLNSNNDIGYYSAKFPFPMSNRDFCNMRAWIELGPRGGYIIRNHSVPHPSCPEQKGFVRGRSIISGYYIQPSKRHSGTTMWWLTQMDPGGALPSWAINTATTSAAPGIMANLGRRGEKYLEWLAMNKPEWKDTEERPWNTPEDPWTDEEDEPGEHRWRSTDVKKAQPSTAQKEEVVEEPKASNMSLSLSGVLPSAHDSKEQSELRAEIQRLQRKLILMASQEMKGTSLAPMRYSPEEPECVAQTRKLVQEVFDFVDRSFLVERRAPSMREYCARVYSVLGTII